MNTVLNYKGYYPYGNELLDTMKQTRQGYISKENDVENRLGDFGVWKHEPITGRFNSVDLLWIKYLGCSSYQYNINILFWAKDGNSKDPELVLTLRKKMMGIGIGLTAVGLYQQGYMLSEYLPYDLGLIFSLSLSDNYSLNK